MLKFISGNIFDKSLMVDAIINTVNCVGVMGKGIALEFKNRYPSNFEIYKQTCESKNLTPGKMLTVKNDEHTSPKFIINFPTKKHWRRPSKIEYIESGLFALKEEIKKHSIRSIAMPALGCGNGGLKWEIVKNLITEELSNLDDVDFYIYEPSQQKATTNIRLTKQRTLLILLLDYYNSSSYKQTVTFVEVNHLAYILQFLGTDLKLHFEDTDKGPFDSTLNKLLLLLANNEFLLTERDEKENLIKINKKKFRQKNNSLKKEELSIVYKNVITLLKGFESKERLKTLTLALWFFSKGAKYEELFTLVKNWVTTHNHPISDSHIRDAVNRVTSFTTPKTENMKFDI